MTFKSFKFWKKDVSKDKIETKAGNNDGGIVTTVVANMPAKISIATDPLSLVRRNSSWVYACNEKISKYISSIPIHLYARVPKGKTIVGKNIKHIKSLNKNIILKSYKEQEDIEIVEITDHPLVKLLEHPYEGYTWEDWIGVISSYLNMLGNAYVYVQKEGDTIVGLKPLNGEYVRPNSDNNGEIKDYFYDVPTPYIKKIFNKKEIIHFVNRTAGNLVIGQGKAESAIKAIGLYDAFNNYESQLLNNGAVPGIVITAKTTNKDQTMADNSANRLRNQFGDLRKGSPMILYGDIDVKSVGTPTKDLSYAEGRSFMLKEIAGVFGIPIDILNPEDSNRATSKEAMNSFLNHTILPELKKILEQININIVEPYDESLFVWFNANEVLQEDTQSKATTIKTYLDAGIITIAEAREQLGLPELEVEDKEEDSKEPKDKGEDINEE